MSKRIIKKLEFVTVRYDSDWEEYSIRPAKDTNDDRSAFETDRESALETACRMDNDFRNAVYPY